MKTCVWTIILYLILFQLNSEITANLLNFNSNHLIENQVIPSSTPKTKKENITQKIGIVMVHNDLVCLKTENAELAEGSPLVVIGSMYFPPQEIVSATVEKKLDEDCSNEKLEEGRGFENPVFYKLKVQNDKIQDVHLTFAVLDLAKSAELKDGQVVVDLNGDGKDEYFRHCASYEGLHLTVWEGKPLKGKRIWHIYYYLGYDTEADCRKKDYEGTND